MPRLKPATRLTAVILSCVLSGPAIAQPPEEITIKLKVFDSNKPKTELVPRNAIIFLRNPLDNQPEYVGDRALEAIPTEKGFYQLKLPKGRLIERIAIQIDSVSGTGYNAAEIKKIVTANDMTIYPGASDPGDTFSFQAYMGQLDSYRGIFNDLIETFDQDRGVAIRKQLKDGFGPLIEKMALAESEGRLLKFTPEQLKTAREATDSLLRLYGLRPEKKPEVAPQAESVVTYPAPTTIYPPPVVFYPPPTYYPIYPPQPVYYPVRWRCR
jgi:hypothetical protein